MARHQRSLPKIVFCALLLLWVCPSSGAASRSVPGWMDPLGIFRRRELAKFIGAMKPLGVQPEGSKTGKAESREVDDTIVTETPFDTTVSVQELAGFNPNAGVLWPGSLVQGRSLKTGVLDPVNVPRASGVLVLTTLGTPVGGQTRTRSVRVRKPSASSVENARVQLLKGGFTVPVKAAQTFKRFYSLDHAMTQIGARASYLSASMKAQLESEKYESQSNVMVLFAQEYYTLAMEPPSSPISYFGSGVTAASLRPYANTTDNPLAYVSSVTYGRIGLLMASSRESYETLKRSMEAYVRWASGSAGANFGDSERKVVNESEVKLLLWGGSDAKSLRLVPTTDEALAAMDQWIKQGIKPRDVQLGLPISYRINYLKDNRACRLSFTTSYRRVTVDSIPQYTDWTLTFNTADDDKDHDTALTLAVSRNGRFIATHEENGEKFGNGSRIVRRLNQVGKLYVRDANNIVLHIRIAPNGRDEWDFDYTLTARNTSGGANFHKAGHMRLSHDRREELQ